jgi:Fe-S cluster assembly protein SufD
MSQLLETASSYRAAFDAIEKELAAIGPAWLRQVRSDALDRFEQLGFPTTDDEEWRFTSVAPIAEVPFTLAARDLEAGALPAEYGFDAHRLVFVNGYFAPHLSDVGALPRGVRVASLADVLRQDPEAVASLMTHYARSQEHAFTALNTSFFRDGAFVSIGRGEVVEKPIHLIFLTAPGDEPIMALPRVLILAGENSQARVVESYLSAGDGLAFTNAVTEVVVEENARLDHCKLQRESTEAFHVAAMQVLLRRDSRCSLLSLALGSALARNEVRAVLDAPGCECSLHGLTLASGRQLIDHHTTIDHARPHGMSRQLYKAVLDGHAHGVFSGKVHVHPDAQKTDARQTNQTLLLSTDAVIDTKPQLEIYADDVKCTHGATVGQLDPDALFYLQTRGIDLASARALLTYGFANEIVSRIAVEQVREQVESYLSPSLVKEGRGGG